VYELEGGVEVRDVHELLDALTTMDDRTFKQYVNEDKNEFADWIRNVFKDYKLATTIKDVRVRAEMTRKIEEHLSHLKKDDFLEDRRIRDELEKHHVHLPSAELSHLEKYVRKMLSEGKSPDEIRQNLRKVKWPSKVIDGVLKGIKK